MVYRLKGTSGAVINQSFPLQGKVTVGVGDEYDISVEGDASGSALAVLEVSEGSVRLVAESTSAVTVNGDQVTALELAGGDELRIGRSRLILQAPGLRPERVLTGDAIRPPKPLWPWWVAAGILVGGGALAWQQGWLTPLLGALGQ